MQTALKNPAKRLAAKATKATLHVSRKVPRLSKADQEFFTGVGKSERFSVAFATKLFLGENKKA